MKKEQKIEINGVLLGVLLAVAFCVGFVLATSTTDDTKQENILKNNITLQIEKAQYRLDKHEEDYTNNYFTGVWYRKYKSIFQGELNGWQEIYNDVENRTLMNTFERCVSNKVLVTRVC